MFVSKYEFQILNICTRVYDYCGKTFNWCVLIILSNHIINQCWFNVEK